MLGFLRPLIVFVIFTTDLGLAQELINFREGEQTTIEQLLAQRKILVYFEHGCWICGLFLREIENCSSRVQQKIQLISVSTPAQTKEIVRKLPKKFPVYWAPTGKRGNGIFATPTTRFISQQKKLEQKLGLIKCDNLENLE